MSLSTYDYNQMNEILNNFANKLNKNNSFRREVTIPLSEYENIKENEKLYYKKVKLLEKIEKAKKHYIFTTKHNLDDDNKRLKDYIQHLEQKESILKKVTDKLKEDIELANEEYTKTLSYREEGIRDEAQEILNIIEGE